MVIIPSIKTQTGGELLLFIPIVDHALLTAAFTRKALFSTHIYRRIRDAICHGCVQFVDD